MFESAEALVGAVYGSLVQAPGHLRDVGYERWLERFHGLHGELERKRSVPRLELRRKFRLEAEEVDLPLVLFAIETVLALLVRAAAIAAAAQLAPAEFHSSIPDLNDVVSLDLEDRVGLSGLDAPHSLSWLVPVVQKMAGDHFPAASESVIAHHVRDPFSDTYSQLFQQMVPRQVRNSLGAFFTPAWLASELLDIVERTGRTVTDCRIVDPTCGSGRFLLEVARRIDTMRLRGVVDSEEAARHLMTSVAGQELNPLSVLAARANLLWAVKALHPGVLVNSNLPVWCGDSLLAPDRLREAGRYDVIVGNPPWVNWEHLPPEYRDSIAPMWPRFGLFDHTGRSKAFSKEDVSVLFTYAALSELASPTGLLAFLLPASVFKSPLNARGFRGMTLGDSGDYLSVTSVDELSAMDAFDGAGGRPAIVLIQRGQKTRYPVPYRVWARSSRRSPAAENEFAITTLEAEPSDPADVKSPWLTLSADTAAEVRSLIGPNSYRARTGLFTGGANGVFHLEILGHDGPLVRVRNVTERAKRFIPTVEASIESTFLFPFLRGREVQDWSSESSIFTLCPHTSESGMYPIAPELLASTAPATFAYLSRFVEPLLERKGFGGWERERLTEAFYSCQRVGPYTFADYKVVWRYIAPRFTCSVVGPGEVMGEAKPCIPNEKLMLVACGSAREAYFLCGVLSTSPVRTLLNARIVGTQISASVISHIALPQFDPSSPAHAELSDICAEGHHADSGLSVARQRAIDELLPNVLRDGSDVALASEQLTLAAL